MQARRRQYAYHQRRRRPSGELEYRRLSELGEVVSKYNKPTTCAKVSGGLTLNRTLGTAHVAGPFSTN